MKFDIIISGVGGQGVLSIARLIAESALRAGLNAVQSEVHGMSQRGGAVVAHLRLADGAIHSGTIGTGQADMIISMEPLEALRELVRLVPRGILLSATEPVVNIPNYPDVDEIHETIRRYPNALLIEATRLAREAGSAKAANVVMVGAAADLLPMAPEYLKAQIRASFRSKGERITEINLDAFAAGRQAVHYRELVDLYEPVGV